MLFSGKKQALVSLALIAACYAGVIWLSGFMECRRPPLPEGFEDRDLTMNGSRLKGFALGSEGLIADWYWMRSLQYVGDKVIASKSDFINIDDLRGLNPRLLYPYLENATDLDPHYIAAYRYGAIVLPAIDAEKAIAIAKKGIANNPDEWRLYQYLGYIYWKLKRYDEAAETFEKGSQVAGSPPFFKMMSAVMRTEGGSRSTARKIYVQMLADSTDDMVKLTADRRLKALDSLDELDAINGVLESFKAKTGRCASSLVEILPMLSDVKLPEHKEFHLDPANRLVDPTDVPYLLDHENCRARLDPEKTSIALR